jgi:hypothetical protein
MAWQAVICDSLLGKTHVSALPIGHVLFGLLDGAFELGRKLQLVFDQIIKPFANLAKLCLRKVAQFGFHLFDFAHLQMIE